MFRVRQTTIKDITLFVIPPVDPKETSNAHMLQAFKYKGELPNLSDRLALDVYLETNVQAMRMAPQ